MKIRFTDSVAGANFAYRKNQVVDLRVDLAKEFLRARQAVEFVEQAVQAAPEQAVASGMIETATQVVLDGAKRISKRLKRNGSHPADLLPPQ